MQRQRGKSWSMRSHAEVLAEIERVKRSIAEEQKLRLTEAAEEEDRPVRGGKVRGTPGSTGVRVGGAEEGTPQVGARKRKGKRKANGKGKGKGKGARAPAPS